MPKAPKGSALAQARTAAHAAFDPLWKRRGGMTRGQAYGWLAKRLGIDKKDCHMFLFDEDMCQKVREVCAPLTFNDLTKGE